MNMQNMKLSRGTGDHLSHFWDCELLKHVRVCGRGSPVTLQGRLPGVEKPRAGVALRIQRGIVEIVVVSAQILVVLLDDYGGDE